VEGEAFLTALAVKGNAASATQNPAPNAIVSLYRQRSRKGSGRLEGMERTKKPARLPVLFRRDEERAVLAVWTGVGCVMARRLYGSGWRLMEYAAYAFRNIDSDRDPLQRVRFRLQTPL
jgi:hypothetical protein